MPKNVLRALALVLCLAAAGAARADGCSAKMTDMVFVDVSPISGADYYASATLTVSCTLMLGLPSLLLPNITYCLSLGAGSGGAAGAWRTMAAGASRLPYNLYTDTSYGAAAVWGGAAMPANQTPIRESVQAGLLGLGVYNRSYTIHGKIPGSALAGVATSGNGDTVYASSFSADASFTYALSTLAGPPSCTSGTSSTLPFQVRATVVNNCIINASSLDFGAGTVGSGAVRASAALGVQCTANNAYRIALDGGKSGAAGERRMKNAASGETLRYVLSATPDGTPWGDGSAGTATVTGTGSGARQNLPLHGRVPAQPIPSPGLYKDTVTATVIF